MAKSKMERDKALPLAEAICAKLADCCERIEIAGSLRRGNQIVGDIEIVAIPRITRTATQPTSLFDGSEEKESFNTEYVSFSTLDVRLTELCEAHKLQLIKGGDRMKCYHILTVKPPIQLDLFLAKPDNWGMILAIRTGPTDYSRHIVTQHHKGGPLAYRHRVKVGFVWVAVGENEATAPDEQTQFIDGLLYKLKPMPEEKDFFELVSGGWVHPSKRRYK